jgi:DNA-binding response OmpR family regulator
MLAPALIVAPNPDLRELVAYGLGRAGFAFESAETGGEALARLVGSRPAALIMDLELSDIHGFGVIEIVRQLWPDDPVPLVVLASRGSADIRDDLVQMGVDAVLSKPFVLEDLVGLVDRLTWPAVERVRKRARLVRAKRRTRRRNGAQQVG